MTKARLVSFSASALRTSGRLATAGSSRRGTALSAAPSGSAIAWRLPSGRKTAQGLPSSCARRRLRSCSERPSRTRSESCSSTAVARRSAPSWRLAASSLECSSSRTRVWVTATAARSAKARASSTSSSLNLRWLSTSSSRIRPTISSLKIIGTSISERIFQCRTVALTIRGSWRALATTTGRRVSRVSRVTPSAGTPATQRLTSSDIAVPSQQPTQPRNRFWRSSRM